MINEEHIVSGERLKNIPLLAAYYGRSFGVNHNERLKEIVNSIKEYVKNETSWDLILGYEDNNCTCKCMCKQVELKEMLEDAYNKSFDLIVVTNFSQIARNKEIVDYLVKGEMLQVPIFCIDTETIVFKRKKELEEFLLKFTDANESEEQDISDCCIHQNSEVYDDEE